MNSFTFNNDVKFLDLLNIVKDSFIDYLVNAFK